MLFENILMGFTNVLQISNLILVFIGTTIGLFVGSMPGLSATMAVAILVPITFGLDPAGGISMLAAIYMGAMYGGSIAAILLRTPGTPAAAATVLDGYSMNKNGYPGKAFGISLTSSFIGGMISFTLLLTVAPVLGWLALQFGPREIFAIALLGMTIIGSLVKGSPTLGILSGTLGLLLSLVGMDPFTGTPRFAFGTMYLFPGFPFVVALIGLFSVPQAIKLIEDGDDRDKNEVNPIKDRMLPTLKELITYLPNIIRSALIGVVTGLIPGTGGDTACWFAYNEAKRFSKRREKFGTGIPEGIASAEAANNAVVGGALIPTITLGIPGSSTTAVLLGGLLVHGIRPGPTLMTEYAHVTYTLIWALLVTNIVMFFVGMFYTKISIYVTTLDNKIVGPLIVVLSAIGAFSIKNSMTDVYIMFGFGILGYLMDKLDIPPAPMVIGLILGHMFEMSFNQSIAIGGGGIRYFFNSPIAVILISLSIFSILQATPALGYIAGKFKRIIS